MEGIELVCFKMISALGAAKSSFMEAIQEAKLGNLVFYNRKLLEIQ